MRNSALYSLLTAYSLFSGFSLLSVIMTSVMTCQYDRDSMLCLGMFHDVSVQIFRILNVFSSAICFENIRKPIHPTWNKSNCFMSFRDSLTFFLYDFKYVIN